MTSALFKMRTSADEMLESNYHRLVAVALPKFYTWLYAYLNCFRGNLYLKRYLLGNILFSVKPRSDGVELRSRENGCRSHNRTTLRKSLMSQSRSHLQSAISILSKRVLGILRCVRSWNHYLPHRRIRRRLSNPVETRSSFSIITSNPIRSTLILLGIVLHIAIGSGGAILIKDRSVATPATNSTKSDAYDYYLRGKVNAGSENPEKIDEAIKLLEQAVAADPNLAPLTRNWRRQLTSRPNRTVRS